MYTHDATDFSWRDLVTVKGVLLHCAARRGSSVLRQGTLGRGWPGGRHMGSQWVAVIAISPPLNN